MLENKRAYKRFDLPLIVKFRPAIGSTSYSLGLAKNLSCEGIGLEARNFNFMLKENLELELKLPQNAASVSLLGDVIWKRQDGKTSYAGIAFNVQDKKKHTDTMKKIASYTSIPLAGAFYHTSSYKEIEEVAEEKPLPKTVEIKSLHEHAIKATEEDPAEKTKPFRLVKQYLNDSKECRVSFLLPQEAARDAKIITVVGDFNNWDFNASPMKRDKNGDFQTTLELNTGREYRFRYLIDGARWENDWLADKYVPNAFGSDDSVVVV